LTQGLTPSSYAIWASIKSAGQVYKVTVPMAAFRFAATPVRRGDQGRFAELERGTMLSEPPRLAVRCPSRQLAHHTRKAHVVPARSSNRRGRYWYACRPQILVGARKKFRWEVVNLGGDR